MIGAPMRPRVVGLGDTYLFALKAQPGGSVGRPYTTAGSKPIGVIGRPARCPAPSNPLLCPSIQRHRAPVPGSTMRTQIASSGAWSRTVASPGGSPLPNSHPATSCLFHTLYDSVSNLTQWSDYLNGSNNRSFTYL